MLDKSAKTNFETEKEFTVMLMETSISADGRKMISMGKECIFFLTAKYLMGC